MIIIVKIALFAIIATPCLACALDKNGNFESRDEQDRYIEKQLELMVNEINSQAPVMLDSDTQFKYASVLNKTVTFTYKLVKVSSGSFSPTAISEFKKITLINMNESACKTQSTRTLIDLGVTYMYIYTGNDDRFITNVVLGKYDCDK